ncbi:hypothetical protein ACHQM5_005717 [Ranunculus cassubicifolius]
MASLHFLLTVTFIFNISLQTNSIPTDSDFTVSSSPDTQIAECGPRLLPLASCAPFIQGSASSPVQSCCDNLIQLYDQQPSCLCMLLNETSLTVSFPINRTLALQLPGLCKLSPDLSDCPGLVLSPGSPESHVFHESNTNSSSLPDEKTVTTAPPVLTPKTDVGSGLPSSVGAKLQHKDGLCFQTIVGLVICGFSMFFISI